MTDTLLAAVASNLSSPALTAVAAHSPAAQAAAGSDAAQAPPSLRTSLKLRLSLLITALLAVVTLAGAVYVVRSARDDIQAEVRSTLNLTSHFLDAQLALLRERSPLAAGVLPDFRLRELSGVRHLSVQFYDNQGRLLDSNTAAAQLLPRAPRWFVRLIRTGVPPMAAETRSVSVNGSTVGRLVISPDPTSETEEMWSTSRGLFELLLLFFVLVNGLVWWAVARAMRPIEHILRALGELQHGKLSARLPQFAEPEMSRISVGFNHMAETLASSVHENRRLTRRLLQTQEEERTRLARELHDEIGQCVSAIHADAAAIRNRGTDQVRESAEAIVEVTAQIKQIVRSMLYRLRPPALESVGLAAALRELVAAFQQRNPQVSCALRCTDELIQVNSEAGTALYRVVQECLTNIALHANARHAVIEVVLPARAADAVRAAGASLIRVTAADDGVGFAPPAGHRGFGLIGIRERASALGGTCTIESQPGCGTRVVVEIPLALGSADES
ncbi:MAG TPA: histidine kinase [Steroidobacteraceae bacterium]|nr:histidine kinase [Steroidobacteraceae bacterium]